MLKCFKLVFTETKVSDKKRLSEKIKEKENRLKKKQQELQEQVCVAMAFFYLNGKTIFL